MPISPIYFYVPNLIGYARVLLAFVGYGAALSDYRITVVSYLLSQLLDAADGYAARKLGQSSTFGAVLDMVTDRASTTCLCIILGSLYPHLGVGHFRDTSQTLHVPAGGAEGVPEENFP